MRSFHLGDLLAQNFHFVLLIGIRQLEEDLVACFRLSITEVQVSVAPNATSKIHVLLLDSQALGVDSTQVGVLEKAHDVRLSGFLERNK